MSRPAKTRPNPFNAASILVESEAVGGVGPIGGDQGSGLRIH